MLQLQAQNGSYIQAWLATVLIAGEDYQTAKAELEKSSGRPSTKEVQKGKKEECFKAKKIEEKQ